MLDPALQGMVRRDFTMSGRPLRTQPVVPQGVAQDRPDTAIELTPRRGSRM